MLSSSIFSVEIPNTRSSNNQPEILDHFVPVGIGLCGRITFWLSLFLAGYSGGPRLATFQYIHNCIRARPTLVRSWPRQGYCPVAANNFVRHLTTGEITARALHKREEVYWERSIRKMIIAFWTVRKRLSPHVEKGKSLRKE